MTDITQESLQKKQKAIDLLAKRYRGLEQRTEDIDLRLRLYFDDLLEHSSAQRGRPQRLARHLKGRAAGCRQVPRCSTRIISTPGRVQTVIRLREGEWGHVRQRVEASQGVTEMTPASGAVGSSAGNRSKSSSSPASTAFTQWINTQMFSGPKSQLLRTERGRTAPSGTTAECAPTSR